MIVVHGGAGAVSKDRHERVRAGVRAAAAAGFALIQRGGSALDAVVAAVRVLEDDPELGGGAGTALTREGTAETCASVMDGATRRVGAVAAVPDLAAPIIVARALLERGDHSVLAGHAALRFAAEIGMAPAAPGALATPRTMTQVQERHAAGGTPSPADGGDQVGAVARDNNGNFAAATSAGGALYRRSGAIEAAAIPGVGTWADKGVAISVSGGDVAFRAALAHRIAARIADGGSPRSAAKDALEELGDLVKGTVAGVIVVDGKSWVAIQRGPAMPCAWVDNAGPGDALGFEI
jgi:beta-aspartyl-peptidase (threonine type)